jgi:hypothetical protein
MYTWRTVKDGKVHHIIQTKDDIPPGPGYEKIPNDHGTAHGDNLAWIDDTGHRIPDKQLVAAGLRADNRGTWHSIDKPGETKQIRELDEEPGTGWTREKPLENEAYQKWDGVAWVVDAEKKEAAEKEQKIAEIQSGIVEYESKLQRPLIALANPDITPEAEAEERAYYAEYTGKIQELRARKLELLGA